MAHRALRQRVWIMRAALHIRAVTRGGRFSFETPKIRMLLDKACTVLFMCSGSHTQYERRVTEVYNRTIPRWRDQHLANLYTLESCDYSPQNVFPALSRQLAFMGERTPCRGHTCFSRREHDGLTYIHNTLPQSTCRFVFKVNAKYYIPRFRHAIAKIDNASLLVLQHFQRRSEVFGIERETLGSFLRAFPRNHTKNQEMRLHLFARNIDQSRVQRLMALKLDQFTKRSDGMVLRWL